MVKSNIPVKVKKEVKGIEKGYKSLPSLNSIYDMLFGDFVKVRKMNKARSFRGKMDSGFQILFWRVDRSWKSDFDHDNHDSERTEKLAKILQELARSGVYRYIFHIASNFSQRFKASAMWGNTCTIAKNITKSWNVRGR